MNKKYSRNKYIHRVMEGRIKSALGVNPAVILTGARQVGKSSLLKNLEGLKISDYFTLDSYTDIETLKSGAENIFKKPGITIIDEVQKYPAVLNAVKAAIDASGRKKKFILSGSANLLLARSVSETLAGRASYLKMGPFMAGEYAGIKGANALDALFAGKEPKACGFNGKFNLKRALWAGMMPVPLLILKNSLVPEWWQGYVDTYLERDLRDISSISDLSDYRKFMKTLSFFAGSMLNETTISRETGISQPTIHRYLNLLETTNIIARIPAYHMNKKKRVLKTPKIYWFDTGLINFFRGIYKPGEIDGILFEHFILNHIMIWASVKSPAASVYCWRTVKGEEVDFIIEHAGRTAAIEVKTASSISQKDAAGIYEFLKTYPSAAGGLIIYAGQKVQRLAGNVYAVPYQCVSGFPI
ncbi:MAG TPA: ATP-binding protein [Candidatus Goldiibacteriota bacterium]|nr:ATP-binding protein [Candidatus Goldiibacteriota bacterium]HRQ44787.1 ATP-binding protein [Candidatus Goldiibacteriota bacterium]